jgi:hypothetical protein
LITYISAFSEKATRSKPSFTNPLAIVEVSEKLSLQPRVWNATFFFMDILPKMKGKDTKITGSPVLPVWNLAPGLRNST